MADGSRSFNFPAQQNCHLRPCEITTDELSGTKSISFQADRLEFLEAFASGLRVPIAINLPQQDINTLGGKNDRVEQRLHPIQASVKHAMFLSYMAATLDLDIPTLDRSAEIRNRVVQQVLALNRKPRQRRLVERKPLPVDLLKCTGIRGNEVKTVLISGIRPNESHLICKRLKFSNVTIESLALERVSPGRIRAKSPNGHRGTRDGNSKTREGEPTIQVHTSPQQSSLLNSYTAPGSVEVHSATQMFETQQRKNHG